MDNQNEEMEKIESTGDGETTHPGSTPTNDPQKKIEELENQRDEYLKGWQRAKADFTNYRKDEMMRMEELARYAGLEIMRELVTTLDSFDLALSTLEKQGAVEKGVYMIKSQIEDILKKRGLQKIECKPGDIFNPAIAEALTEIETDAVPSGHVVDVIEQGYMLHEKTLRPARVRIAK
jgi:molecular chaperone GrpE